MSSDDAAGRTHKVFGKLFPTVIGSAPTTEPDQSPVVNVLATDVSPALNATGSGLLQVGAMAVAGVTDTAIVAKDVLDLVMMEPTREGSWADRLQNGALASKTNSVA